MNNATKLLRIRAMMILSQKLLREYLDEIDIFEFDDQAQREAYDIYQQLCTDHAYARGKIEGVNHPEDASQKERATAIASIALPHLRASLSEILETQFAGCSHPAKPDASVQSSESHHGAQ